MKDLEASILEKLDDATYYARFEQAAEVAWPAPDEQAGRQPFAVIVPYRNSPLQERTLHLARFIEEMSPRITATGVEGWIIIVEQSDDGRRFNRGRLLNIGFTVARARGVHQHILHDVDLLPDTALFSYYGRPCPHPLHLAARWDKYQRFDLFFGGVTAFSTDDFERANGYPNDFWGWGGEDEELYHRLVECGLSVAVPTTGAYQELRHQRTKEIPSMVNHQRFAQIEHRTKFGAGNGLVEMTVHHISEPVLLAPQTLRFTVELDPPVII